jgi:hypothetical protein
MFLPSHYSDSWPKSSLAAEFRRPPVFAKLVQTFNGGMRKNLSLRTPSRYTPEELSLRRVGRLLHQLYCKEGITQPFLLKVF